MIYNSNPYKRKMESMQVNVTPSAPSKTDKPTTKQVPIQKTVSDSEQPVEQSIPPIEITPYVPEVKGVEVPKVSLEDIEPTNHLTETVDSSEPSNPEQIPAIHYFYCTKPDGKEVVYKRNTASASYKSDITSFRKNLEKEGIVINKEEIK